MLMRSVGTVAAEEKRSLLSALRKDVSKNYIRYLIILPVLIYLLLFCYKPMYGIVIAFKQYRPTRTIAESEWVGLKFFLQFFKDPYFFRLLRNTFSISGLSILFGFPAPILFALFLNEISSTRFKRAVQTISYLPHFISIVIVCGLLNVYSASDGLFNIIRSFFGLTPVNLLTQKKYFYPIYILSGIWQEIGWSSIIYLAAIAGIDQEQYEAARIDGAGRFCQMWNITLPSLLPTIMTLFILRMGNILSVGSEKILLLYQPTTYEVADVINTYVYRIGIENSQYSFSTAVGLFNSVVNITFLLLTNHLSKKMSSTSLF